MEDEAIESENSANLEDDVDALFKLPLAEFTGARNDLAARLKRERRADDSKLVKALAKPSISAWAVNQLHWNHREAFERLLATGQRFRQSQTSHPATRIADLRGSLVFAVGCTFGRSGGRATHPASSNTGVKFVPLPALVSITSVSFTLATWPG